MSRGLHAPSFAYGVFAAVVLGCVIGAATNDGSSRPRYDATSAMGGIVLQIVDHDTNLLYTYKRDEKDDNATYKLVEKVDLSLAGNAEISADLGG